MSDQEIVAGLVERLRATGDRYGIPVERDADEAAETLTSQAAEIGRLKAAEDTALLDMLRDECWDLRCFDVPTGGDDADVAWRVVGHWQAEPRERVIAEGFSDDPRVALRRARTALGGGA